MKGQEQILSYLTPNIKSEYLSTVLDDFDGIVIQALSDAYDKAGHTLTGALISDISSDVEVNSGGFIIDYLSYKYGAYLNFGVKPVKIPYNRGSGAAKSAYITGLMKYVQLRMGIGDEKKQKSIAFAIAETQKKKGMPAATPLGSGWADGATEQVFRDSEIMFTFLTLAETYIVEGLKIISKEFNNGNNSK